VEYVLLLGYRNGQKTPAEYKCRDEAEWLSYKPGARVRAEMVGKKVFRILSETEKRK
jgi:hypothetical protein